MLIEGVRLERGEMGGWRKFSVSELLRLALRCGLEGGRLRVSESRWEEVGRGVVLETGLKTDCCGAGSDEEGWPDMASGDWGEFWLAAND
jgi:hypothetical protein